MYTRSENENIVAVIASVAEHPTIFHWHRGQELHMSLSTVLKTDLHRFLKLQNITDTKTAS